MNRYWILRHDADTECIKDAVRSMNEDIRELSKYCDELEERINKAIEYLENTGLSNYEKELYNILTGEDNEE